MNTTRHHHKLENLYEIAGFTKQAHKQYMKRRENDEQVAALVLNAIQEVRAMHNIRKYITWFYLMR